MIELGEIVAGSYIKHSSAEASAEMIKNNIFRNAFFASLQFFLYFSDLYIVTGKGK